MRTLGELLTALKADGHQDARAIKIHKNSDPVQVPRGLAFVAVNPGESDPLPITDDERVLLVNNQATYDDREWYPTAT
jgi:hypothetical protein